MKTLLASFLTFSSLISIAQLGFDQTAALSDHLMEVNEQWRLVDGHERFTELVAFNSEEERIETHLHHAIAIVRENHDCESAPLGITCEMMDQLTEYACDQSFPINNKVDHRQPVFIDDFGTACAVGYLMQENGFAGLAETVRDNMNLAYVKEIPVESLSGWQNASQLTIDEMALIQPGYSPSTLWVDHGGNIEGDVRCIVDWNGTLYIGGDFLLDGVQTYLAHIENGVAVGVATEAYFSINDLIVYEGKLYAAGAFTGNNNLMIYDGVDMTYHQVGMSKVPLGYKFAADGDDLYFSVDASGFVAMSAILHYDGSDWAELGFMDLPAYALRVFDGDLYIGGEFITMEFQDWASPRVAKWNGSTWEPLGEGLANTVYDFAEYFGGIVACGNTHDMDDNINFGTAMFDNGLWTYDNWDLIFPDPGTDTLDFRGFLPNGDDLLIYGDFQVNGWSLIGSDLATYNSTVDIPVLEAQFVGTTGGIKDAVMFEDHLWIVGDFSADFYPASNVASANLTTAIVDPKQEFSFEAYPNPAQNETRIDAGIPFNSLSIHDAYGKIISVESFEPVRTRVVDLGGLSSGTYLVEITDLNNQRSVRKVVVLD